MVNIDSIARKCYSESGKSLGRHYFPICIVYPLEVSQEFLLYKLPHTANDMLACGGSAIITEISRMNKIEREFSLKSEEKWKQGIYIWEWYRWIARWGMSLPIWNVPGN